MQAVSWIITMWACGSAMIFLLARVLGSNIGLSSVTCAAALCPFPPPSHFLLSCSLSSPISQSLLSTCLDLLPAYTYTSSIAVHHPTPRGVAPPCSEFSFCPSDDVAPLAHTPPSPVTHMCARAYHTPPHFTCFSVLGITLNVPTLMTTSHPYARHTLLSRRPLVWSATARYP